MTREDWQRAWDYADHYSRIRVFVAVCGSLDDETYWKCLSECWQDSDRNNVDPAVWRMLFGVPRPKREMMMTEGERAELAALPDRVTVYRGVNRFNYIHTGLSWTLDRAKGEWFARRYASDADPNHLIIGQVKRERILALFQARDESEALVFPRHVYDRSIVVDLAGDSDAFVTQGSPDAPQSSAS